MVGDLSAISVGHLVALTVQNCHQEPIIGRVLEVMEDEIKIVWLNDDYSTAWKTAKYVDQKK